jgi:transposase-like protein
VGHKKQTKFTDEFKSEAVRVLLSCDRPLAEVATDLGIGKSTLG